MENLEEEDEEEFDEPKTSGATIDCYCDEEGNNVYKYAIHTGFLS
jgi:hypothetical protein